VETAVAVVTFATGIVGCASEPPEPTHAPASSPAEETTVSQRSLNEVVDAVAPEWMTWNGVTMVYAGTTDDGRPAVKVGVVTLPHDVQDRIPDEVEGYPVVVIESGEVRPLGG
jgi:hypothetical protein